MIKVLTESHEQKYYDLDSSIWSLTGCFSGNSITQTDTHLATIVELSAYLHVFLLLDTWCSVFIYFFILFIFWGEGVFPLKKYWIHKYFCQILRSFNDPLPIFYGRYHNALLNNLWGLIEMCLFEAQWTTACACTTCTNLHADPKFE